MTEQRFRTAREPFGNGSAVVAIGDVVAHADVSSSPILIEVAA